MACNVVVLKSLTVLASQTESGRSRTTCWRSLFGVPMRLAGLEGLTESPITFPAYLGFRKSFCIRDGSSEFFLRLTQGILRYRDRKRHSTRRPRDRSFQGEDERAYPIKVNIRHLNDDEATPFQNDMKVPDGLFRSTLAKDDNDDLIRKSRGEEGTTEIIRAKYMIGCDGAHSWTRRQLGFQMQGE